MKKKAAKLLREFAARRVAEAGDCPDNEARREYQAIKRQMRAATPAERARTLAAIREVRA